MNFQSRYVPPCIRLIGLCLLTLFNKLPQIEAAPVFEPLQALELSPKNPQSDLILGSDGNFYGTTSTGGFLNLGTVFRMTPDGVLTTLVHFTGSNGSTPLAGLIRGSDGNFYGTTSGGEESSGGTVFKMTPAGELTTLATFSWPGAYSPQAKLFQDEDGNFYGTTCKGGGGYGTVFKMTLDGTLTTLAQFTGSNGREPVAGLIKGGDGNFYGTTRRGGDLTGQNAYGNGTIFRITPGGTLTTLVIFNRTNGQYPSSDLIQGTDGSLYGTTTYGGSNGSAGYGTVFKITTEGAFTTVFNFSETTGIWPFAGLILGQDGNFYGTTSQGSSNGLSSRGSVFRMTPQGTLTTLASLSTQTGYFPQAALVQDTQGNLYGTTFKGGEGTLDNIEGGGSIFKIPPDGPLEVLVSFKDWDGLQCPDTLSEGTDGNLYGTTQRGGRHGMGTVFKMTRDGVLTTLADFHRDNGSYPDGGVVQGTDGNFYGTTWEGGKFNNGTVFKMTQAGTLTTLTSFDGRTNASHPRGRLVPGDDGNLYGTTLNAAFPYKGTVFRVTPDGDLTILVNFTGANGESPAAGLVRGTDGNFYGTTSDGGTNKLGTVFKMTQGGTLTTMVHFNGPNGRTPYAGLIQASDGNFYGTTSAGGSSSVPNGSYGVGTVFKVTPEGTLTTLANFTDVSLGIPYAGVVEGSDGNFYGNTPGNVYYNTFGKVFQMTPDGTVTTMVDFNGPNGDNPQTAGLMQASDGNLYGITFAGGTTVDGRLAGGGQIFRLKMDPVPVPEIAVESPDAISLTDGTASVSFGPVMKTASVSITFTIRNIGSSDLTGISLSVDGTNGADFSVTSNPATTVAGPSGVTTFAVRFSPKAAGFRTATLHIASDDSDENPFDIEITGTGVQPVPEISVAQPAGSKLADAASKISFGTAQIGKGSAVKTFVIKNTGSALLTGIAIGRGGDHKKDFIITPPAETRLAPGASLKFKVQFKPTARKTRNASIHIRSNDADESPFDINLTGFGATP